VGTEASIYDTDKQMRVKMVKKFNKQLAIELVNLAKTDEAMYVPESEAERLAAVTHEGVPCFLVDLAERNPENLIEVVVSATEAGIKMFNPIQSTPSMSDTTPNTLNTLNTPNTPNPNSNPVASSESKGFTIFRGYEHPKRSASHLIPKEAKYPWNDMKIGDAIFVPAVWNAEIGKYTSVVSAVAVQNRKQSDTVREKRFTSRKGEYTNSVDNSVDNSVLSGEWIKCEAWREPRPRKKKTEVASSK